MCAITTVAATTNTCELLSESEPESASKREGTRETTRKRANYMRENESR